MSRRRASAFTTDSELSLSQTDEIRLKAVPGSGQRGSSGEAAPWDPWVRRKAAWLIYFVGFIVSPYGVERLFTQNATFQKSNTIIFCARVCYRAAIRLA